MKPLKLIIDGVNSFAERQEIDFEALTERGFFGIFGPTGSGKSTILDGITLALYGIVARKSANYIHTSRNRCSVSFRFSVRGAVVKTYLAEREFRREKSGGIRGGRCILADVTGEEPVVLADSVREMNRICVEIIGLSSDDFLRTVVLPQGKFSEFLTLRGNDRNEMLERLFHLEQYGEELTEKLKKRSDAAKSRLQSLEGETRAYGDLTEEMVAAKGQETEAAQDHCRKTEEAAKEAELRQREYQEIWGIQREYQEAEKRLQELQQDAAAMDQARISRDTARKAAPIAEASRRLEDGRKKMEGTGAQVHAMEERRPELLKKREEAFLRKEAAVKDREDKAQRGAIYLKQLQDTAQWEHERSQLAQMLEIRRKNLTQMEAESRQLRVQATEALKRADEYKAQSEKLQQQWTGSVMDPQEMAQIRQGAEYENRLRQHLQEREALNRNQEEWQRKQKTALVMLEKYRDQEEILKKQVSQQEEERRLREQDRILRIYREQLSEGVPCPVCGSVHHPGYVRDVEAEEKHLQTKDMDQLSSQLEDCRRRMGRMEGQLEALDKEKEQMKLQQLQWEKGRKELADSLEQIRQCVKLPEGVVDFSAYGRILEEQEGRRNQLARQMMTMNQEREKCMSKIRRMEEQCLQKEKEEARLRADIEAGSGRVAEYEKAINDLWKGNPKYEAYQPALTFQEDASPFWSRQALRIEQWLTALHEREKAALKEFEVIQQQFDVAEKELQSKRAVWLEQQEQEARDRKQLDQLVTQLGFASVVEAMKWYLSQEDIEKLEAKIRLYEEQCNRVQGSLQSLKEKLNGRSVSEEAKLEAESRCQQLKQETEVWKKRCTELHQEWKRMEENWEKLKELQKEKKKEEHTYGQLEELRKLFSGKKFVQFVAAEKLKYVSLEASDILYKISGGHYGLETGAEGEFTIRDYQNGGVAREPSTLSGGETFLTSLALALSLSNQIQLTNHAPLELFFLDEGFGTLDEERLDEVMSALENLPGRRRAIGLISHVTEIRNRIPVRLHVAPSEMGGKGSKVRLERS